MFSDRYKCHITYSTQVLPDGILTLLVTVPFIPSAHFFMCFYCDHKTETPCVKSLLSTTYDNFIKMSFVYPKRGEISEPY